jgi:hypothetical protein
MSEWLLEFSVLLTVFPALDHVLRGRIETRILVGALVLAIVFLGLGLGLVSTGGDP